MISRSPGARAAQPAQPEHHSQLVLPHDPHRQHERQQHQHRHHDDDDDQRVHRRSPFLGRTGPTRQATCAL